MASGETLDILYAQGSALPSTASTYAQPAVIAGADATSAEAIPCLAFDSAVDEYADFLFILPQNYAGGGLTVRLGWTSASATSNATVWDAAIRAFPDDAEDLDTTDHAYDFNTVTATAPSAAGEIVYDNITFTDGADMDSLAKGDLAILRIRRNGDDGSDTMTGDAYLLSIEIRET